MNDGENITNSECTDKADTFDAPADTLDVSAPDAPSDVENGKKRGFFSRIRCLDSLTLKIIAMALMFCDHTWVTVAYEHEWLTVIGRIAFPIFAFQIVEGFFHTHSRGKYLLRMFIFALVSEIPFNFLVGGGPIYPFHQNVMFTFCISLLTMMVLERAKRRAWWVFLIAVIVAVPLTYVLGFFTFVDYFGYGILTVLVFYLFHGVKFGWIAETAALIYINWVMIGGRVFYVTLFGRAVEIPEQGFAVFALIPIMLYNGKPGSKNKVVQYVCYAFYPVHMIVLVALSHLLF